MIEFVLELLERSYSATSTGFLDFCAMRKNMDSSTNRL